MAIAREPQINGDSVETTRQHLNKTQKITKAYLLGALHDATERRLTYRISQKSKEYVELISDGINSLGRKAWIYQEGKNREAYIVEFSKFWLKDFKIKSSQDKIHYIRGYFDTEGGIAKNPEVRYYIYFAQKDLADLREVKYFLEELKIFCGKIHNPSKKVDPNYWRFYIRSKSYVKFAKIIGSCHPVKKRFLRMKR